MAPKEFPRGRHIILTNHAVEQFRERSLEGVGSLENARTALASIIGPIQARQSPPDWQRHYRNADAWIGTSRLSLPLMQDAETGKWVAITCLHYDSTKLSNKELRRTGVLSPRKARL